MACARFVQNALLACTLSFSAAGGGGGGGRKWPITFCLKGPLSATPLFLFICESLAIIFYSEHVEIKEIAVKLLKMMKHIFRNTTKISLHHATSIISMASKMAAAD